MFPKLLCLIALCTLCVASDLEYFTQKFTGFHTNNDGSVPRGKILVLLIKDEDQAIEACARECRLVPYFCHSFAMSKQKLCLLSPAYGAKSILPSSWPLNKVLAVYELSGISGPELVRDVIARFSYSNKTPVEQWASGILAKYLISSPDSNLKLNRDILGVCKTAIHDKPAVMVNFEEWLSREPASKPHHILYDKLMDIVKSWAQRSSNSKTFSEGVDTIVLTFLEVFGRNARADITTLYDPTSKILFIRGDGLYLLIVSFGPDHYEIVQYVDSRYGGSFKRILIVAATSQINPHHEKLALKHFQDAMARIDWNYNTITSPEEIRIIDTNNDEQSMAGTVLITVAKALFPPGFNQPDKGPSDEEIIIYRDLVTAVLSNVYGRTQKSIASFQENFSNKASGALKSGLIDIITN